MNLPHVCTCPTCGYSSRSLLKQRLPSTSRTPEPGDLSLCFNCGEILEFDKAMVLQIATVAKLMLLNREQSEIIDVAQDFVRTHRPVENGAI